MKTEKSIKYTLSINEPEGHGILYHQSLDNDIAGLMIGLQVLETNLLSLKDLKKAVKGEDKGADRKAVGSRINEVSRTIGTLNMLVMQLCDSYDLVNASAHLKEAKLAITE